MQATFKNVEYFAPLSRVKRMQFFKTQESKIIFLSVDNWPLMTSHWNKEMVVNENRFQCRLSCVLWLDITFLFPEIKTEIYDEHTVSEFSARVMCHFSSDQTRQVGTDVFIESCVYGSRLSQLLLGKLVSDFFQI